MKQMTKNKAVNAKTAKHSSVVEKSATNNNKPTTPFFDYLDTFTFKMKPISIPAIERLAMELSNWAINNEEAIKLSQFYLKKGINPADFFRWMEWCPELKLAHDLALTALGNRRELAGLTKKFDSGMVSFTMPFYDEQWRKNIEWRSHLKSKEAEQAGSNGPQIVVLERYPDSELVPKKPESVRRLTPEEVAYNAHKKTKNSHKIGRGT